MKEIQEKLDQLAEFEAQATVLDAHNSLGDARMTAELLRYLAKENPEYLIPEPIRWRWWEK